MILCCCTGTSDRDLRTLVREGARDLTSIGEACGAGACCGGCRPQLLELLREEHGARECGGAPKDLSVVASPRPHPCVLPRLGT
jgi:bacterioferritin-associated ferredoxin